MARTYDAWLHPCGPLLGPGVASGPSGAGVPDRIAYRPAHRSRALAPFLSQGSSVAQHADWSLTPTTFASAGSNVDASGAGNSESAEASAHPDTGHQELRELCALHPCESTIRSRTTCRNRANDTLILRSEYNLALTARPNDGCWMPALARKSLHSGHAPQHLNCPCLPHTPHQGAGGSADTPFRTALRTSSWSMRFKSSTTMLI